MKNYTTILLFLFFNLQASSAQSHYNSRLYNDNQCTSTDQIWAILPYEAAEFFNNWQNMLSNTPVTISQNCSQCPLADTNNRAFDGFTLSDFFRRFKRKRKVTYSKGAHIIPLL
jgi:hypothetical protein